MVFKISNRRAKFIDITKKMGKEWISAEDKQHFESLDLIYRSLCAMLYNYVPMSGHPGGSISSGRFVSSLLFNLMDYDISNPDREDSDIISYAAGHKAMGLYAFWALRNEIIRIGAPGLLSKEEQQLRLEDLLGFRRNPVNKTPLFLKFKSKPLDGHPTPATPFVKLSTGASGVGIGSSIGLAFGAKDYYGKKSPYVHIIEGEGGLTPGRVSEALAAAGTSSLKNVILHVDWNQASIDSNKVCREGKTPGDYVQWDPLELAYFHDWNVIFVPDGFDFGQIFAAQKTALKIKNSQPTAIIYRTTKGWNYGIEGKASHGAGHSMCSEGFYQAINPILNTVQDLISKCENSKRCEGGKDKAALEECFWKGLQIIRTTLEKNKPTIDALVQKLVDSKTRLDRKKLKPRSNAPEIDLIFETASKAEKIPDELVLDPGKTTTLRGELGKVLNYYNKVSKGSILTASADLLGSTSVSTIAKGFPEGYYNADKNPEARLLSTGGICEDGMSAILSGISTYGHHVGVGSSYGAFIAPLGHIASRLHAIGNQARKGPYKPMILVCAHAGVKTGEDGPTHADPQALQVFQENFPTGTLITLTPWDPQEIWNLVSAALAKRPAVIVPFVTRPNEKILDRKAIGLAPVTDAAYGVYLLHKAEKSNGTVVLQGSEVAYAFAEKTLPLLKKEGKDVDAYYVSSAELFDLLPASEQEKIYPNSRAQEAMGITGFTMPTMDRWIRSEYGKKSTIHPFKEGHYLGSGQAEQVLKEAGLDGESQFEAILKYVKGKS